MFDNQRGWVLFCVLSVSGYHATRPYQLGITLVIVREGYRYRSNSISYAPSWGGSGSSAPKVRVRRVMGLYSVSVRVYVLAEASREQMWLLYTGEITKNTIIRVREQGKTTNRC